MTSYGIDESWGKLSPAQVKAAGKQFVIGYVSRTPAKNLTRAQVQAYHAAGLAVLLVYEGSTDDVSGGTSAGRSNGQLAVTQAGADGYPTGHAIAFAVDQPSPSLSALRAYATAFTSVCHASRYRSMVYGGYRTIKYCADNSLTDYYWQTYAWSGTPPTWDRRAHIRQVKNNVTIAGVQVDLDTAMVANYGAWEGTDVNAGDKLSNGLTVDQNIVDAHYVLTAIEAPNGDRIPMQRWCTETTAAIAKLQAAIDALNAKIGAAPPG